MTQTDYLDFDTPEAAAAVASITQPDTKLAPGEYPAKVACVRTFGRSDTLWLEVIFAVPSGDPVEPLIAPIAASSSSPHADRVVEGLRLIKALYACELRSPPSELKARHLTHFAGMSVTLTVAVSEKDGAKRSVVRTFERRSAKDLKQ
jgi:hypothetical protein